MDRALNDVEAIYREHGSALLAYLRGLGRVGQSADDLLQETFVQAITHRERMTQAVSVRAWLFGIARHVALTAARRARPTAALPEQLAARAEAQIDGRVEAMRDAISRLPDGQRESLELRLRDGLSYEEIAQVLAVPVGTVRSRLHHAVRALRERLTNGDAGA